MPKNHLSLSYNLAPKAAILQIPSLECSCEILKKTNSAQQLRIINQQFFSEEKSIDDTSISETETLSDDSGADCFCGKKPGRKIDNTEWLKPTSNLVGELNSMAKNILSPHRLSTSHFF